MTAPTRWTDADLDGMTGLSVVTTALLLGATAWLWPDALPLTCASIVTVGALRIRRAWKAARL